jgi:hydrogenase maturation protein HypF
MSPTENKRTPLRREVGRLPDYVELSSETPTVLAAGSEGSNTFCLTQAAKAYVSWDTGDLTTREGRAFYRESVKELCDRLDARPAILAHDLHPDYISTRCCMELGIEESEPVQHHHAHMAACMAENGLENSVIGILLDGLGLGDDGTLWGGEFLVGDMLDYRRAVHFKPYALPGGDSATLHPERMAFSCLLAEFGSTEKIPRGLLSGLKEDERTTLARMIEKDVRSPLTSSAGRLFDAVSAIVSFKGKVKSQGEAAIMLQSIADENADNVYGFELSDGVLSFGPMLMEIAEDVLRGRGVGEISGGFHNTLACAAVCACEEIKRNEDVSDVVLSGGVFYNSLLKSKLTDQLSDAGFTVHNHQVLPPGDTCLSLGQAAVAVTRHAKKEM